MPGEPNLEINPQDKLRAEILAELNQANFITQQSEGKYVHTSEIAGHAVELTAFPDGKCELKVDGNMIEDPDLIAKIKEQQMEIKI